MTLYFINRVQDSALEERKAVPEESKGEPEQSKGTAEPANAYK
jgi:hypothetical protein